MHFFKKTKQCLYVFYALIGHCRVMYMLAKSCQFFYIKWNGQFQNEKRTKAQMFQVSCIAKVFFFLMGRELNFL